MRRRLIATTILAGLLALPGTAQAKYDMNGGGGTKATIERELSANEQIMADAWKSHFHAFKAAALEGLE